MSYIISNTTLEHGYHVHLTRLLDKNCLQIHYFMYVTVLRKFPVQRCIHVLHLYGRIWLKFIKTHVESLEVILFHSHSSSEFKEYPTISFPELSGIIGRETTREVINREPE